MRIGSNLNSNICVNNISKVISKNNEQKKNNEVSLSGNRMKKNPQLVRKIKDDILKYKTVYNHATLESSNKICNDYSDEELSNMLDKKLYDSCHLKDLGIQYGSKEYEDWKDKWKNNIVIPLDAPPKIRKKLSDLMDSTQNEAIKISFADSLIDNLKGVDTSNPKSYLDLCDKVISENNNFISSMNSSGAVSNPYVKAAVDLKKSVNECFFKLRLDLEDMFKNK